MPLSHDVGWARNMCVLAWVCLRIAALATASGYIKQSIITPDTKTGYIHTANIRESNILPALQLHIGCTAYVHISLDFRLEADSAHVVTATIFPMLGWI